MTFAPVHFTTGPVAPTLNVSSVDYQLGFCEDGVTVSLDPRWDEIFSDDFGGRGGPPSDAQFLGATGSVQMVFTKYNKTYLDNLSCFTSAALTTPAKGLLPAIGSFARQDSLGALLKLIGPGEDLRFAFAFLRGRYEMNSGTRWRRYVMSFDVWMAQSDFTLLTTAQARRIYTMA
jgi:hypothetical protein